MTCTMILPDPICDIPTITISSPSCKFYLICLDHQTIQMSDFTGTELYTENHYSSVQLFYRASENKWFVSDVIGNWELK